MTSFEGIEERLDAYDLGRKLSKSRAKRERAAVRAVLESWSRLATDVERSQVGDHVKVVQEMLERVWVY